MLYGLVVPSAGALSVFELDVKENIKEIKARVGIVPQENNLDEELTTLENLLVYARYFQIPFDVAKKRALELLGFVNLSEKMGTFITELSGGMKRRLILARALINEPQLLILDEPATGLDPQGRHLIWQKLRELRRQGLTLLLTTQYMDEAETLCNALVIMDRGKIVEKGEPKKLIENHAGKFVLQVQEFEDSQLSRLQALSDGQNAAHFGDTFYYFSKEQETLVNILNQIPNFRSVLRPANLEDVFLKLTGRELVE